MKNDATLVVMAAGMGSRFGGLKQIEPIGPNGEVILDFSVYDAVKAGFDKAVFIIRKDIEKDFREMAGKRIEKMGGRELFAAKETKQKAVAALLRYGFSYDNIKEALKKNSLG